jgi:YD repeat-containing protein
VIFLDDGAVRVDAAARLQRNDWREWETRLPTFPGLLNKFVADFHRATGEQVQKRDSLFALEVAAGLPPEQKDKVIAEELERIFTATGRPSSILARTTNGDDQLRLVFQDGKDYRPAHAAKFLRKFAEISPAIAHSGIAAHFGPFQPPPTIVFDPRPGPVSSLGGQASRSRWALLEDKAYLLPHYVLHSLATLSDGIVDFGNAFAGDAALEPGNVATQRTNLYIAAAGINSPPDSGFTPVEALARSRASNPVVVQINIADWKARGNDFNNPATLEAIRTQASMETRSAMSQGRDIVFSVIPDLKPYNPAGRNAPDYFGNRQKWDTEAGIQAKATDAIMRGWQQAGGTGQTNYFGHSEGVYSFTKTSSDTHFNHIELHKGRVGPDALVPRLKQETDHGASAILAAGKGDYWSLWNVATWSTAKQVADQTGATAIYDRNWHGHGISLTPSNYDIYSPKSGHVTGMPVDLKTLTSASFKDTCGCGNPPPGGILFDKRNIYVLELTGRVSAEAQVAVEAWRNGDGTFLSAGRETVSAGFRIPGMARKPSGASDAAGQATGLSGQLFTLQLDFTGQQNGSLPFAIPRFLTRETEAGGVFGGPWSFEPLSVQGLEKLRTSRIAMEAGIQLTVLPAETGGVLRYAAFNRVAADKTSGKAEILESFEIAKANSRFQPELAAREDGTYDWRLRHGVTVLLSSTGLVQTIREPSGHTVTYVRDQAQRLTAKQTSDGRVIHVAREEGRPVALRVGDLERVRYEYSGALLRTVSAAHQVASIEYQGDRPRRLHSGPQDLRLGHDPQGRLTSVTAGRRNLGFEYVSLRNAIQASDAGRTVDWRLGPRGNLIGVVMGNEAILWTRSVEGRIIQVAFGHLQDEAGKTTKKFIVDDTIGTAPKL